MAQQPKRDNAMQEKDLDPLVALDQVPDMSFALKDAEGCYIFVNKSMRQQFGFTSNDQMRGYSNKELLTEVTDDALTTLALQDDVVCREEKALDILYTFMLPNGQLDIFSGGKSPHYNEEGHCIGIIGKSMRLRKGHLCNLGKLLFSDSLRFSSKASLAFDIVDEPEQHHGLSTRESECLFFLLRGKTMKEIGSYLNISAKTVDYYLQQLRIKFDCHTRSQLVDKALACGLLFFIPKSLTTLYPRI